MLPDRPRHLRGLAVQLRIDLADHTLQLRELADHLGNQVRLAQRRRPEERLRRAAIEQQEP